MKFLLRILLCLGIFFISSCNVTNRKEVQVKNGVMDLRAWNFETDGPVNLEGDWEFYWNKLYFPADYTDSLPPSITSYLRIPGIWNGLNVNGEKISGMGFGTYRARILLNHYPDLMSIKMMDEASSFRLYVNGVLLETNGVVSADPDSMRPQLRPLLSSFDNKSDTLELVLQVANNFHSKGGAWTVPSLGPQRIMTLKQEKAYLDFLIVGIMALLGLYHFWIFFLRRSEKTAFWFGVLCVLIALRNFSTEERFLNVFLPQLGTELVLKLEYLPIAMGISAFAMMMFYIYSEVISRKITYFILYLSLFEGSLILFLPAHIYSALLDYFLLSMLIKTVYVIFNMVRVYIQKQPWSGLFLLALLILLACTIHDILLVKFVVESVYLIPYGFLISVLVQAYILVSRISNAFQTVESLTQNLEQKVNERTYELEAEKSKAEELLLNILPAEVAQELKKTGKSSPKTYGMVTVMFTDFKGFTSVSEKVSPELLVEEINYCFSEFDRIIQKYNIEKIKTVGDSYICASGLPALSYSHATDMLQAAIEIRDFIKQRMLEKELKKELPFEIRIGIHTGPVVAGIVGVKKFAYDIWGDTVNLASRMESSGEAGKVNISGATYVLVKDKFHCEYRGKIDAKNKGQVDMYFAEPL